MKIVASRRLLRALETNCSFRRQALICDIDLEKLALASGVDAVLPSDNDLSTLTGLRFEAWLKKNSAAALWEYLKKEDGLLLSGNEALQTTASNVAVENIEIPFKEQGLDFMLKPDLFIKTDDSEGWRIAEVKAYYGTPTGITLHNLSFAAQQVAIYQIAISRLYPEMHFSSKGMMIVHDFVYPYIRVYEFDISDLVKKVEMSLSQIVRAAKEESSPQKLFNPKTCLATCEMGLACQKDQEGS